MLLHWGSVHTDPVKATLCQSSCNRFSVKAETFRRASRGRLGHQPPLLDYCWVAWPHPALPLLLE